MEKVSLSNPIISKQVQDMFPEWDGDPKKIELNWSKSVANLDGGELVTFYAEYEGTRMRKTVVL